MEAAEKIRRLFCFNRIRIGAHLWPDFSAMNKTRQRNIQPYRPPEAKSRIFGAWKWEEPFSRVIEFLLISFGNSGELAVVAVTPEVSALFRAIQFI